VIPSKIFEAMAMEKPIILGVQGEAQQILEEADAGIAVEPENPDDLASAISKLADSADLRMGMGRRGRAFVARSFDREQLAMRFVSLFSDLARQKRRDR
jgi:glycosyltransferase involved in cell wall biosynthesis